MPRQFLSVVALVFGLVLVPASPVIAEVDPVNTGSVGSRAVCTDPSSSTWVVIYSFDAESTVDNRVRFLLNGAARIDEPTPYSAVFRDVFVTSEQFGFDWFIDFQVGNDIDPPPVVLDRPAGCSPPPETGTLEVTKTVDWADATPQTAQTFEVCVQGPSYPDGNESGACQATDADGGVLTWTELNVGDYTVTETDPGGDWSVEIAGSPATVAPDGTASAAVTNTYLRPAPEVRCRGQVATIVGTPGRDELTGTPRKDVIAALDGNDVVRSGGGRDVICLGSGEDRAAAGKGGDVILGGAGRDRVGAGMGKDVVLGGSGRDQIAGKSGGDRLRGGRGNDDLDGGSGRDRCVGGPGTDRAARCEVVRSIP